jgi:hypothetical protein
MSAISSPASSAPHDAKPLFRSEYGHFIGGEWVRGETGRLIEQINPATGAFVLQARLAQIEFESPTPRKIRSASLCCESDRVRG